MKVSENLIADMRRLSVGAYSDKRKTSMSIDEELKRLLQNLPECEEKEMSENNENQTMDEMMQELEALEAQEKSENTPVEVVMSNEKFDDFDVEEESTSDESGLDFFDMKLDIVFSIPLNDPKFFDKKKSLSEVVVQGEEYDFYAPFKKRGAKNVGAFRSVLTSLLEEAEQLNQKFAYVGNAESMAQMAASVQQALYKKLDSILFSIGSPSFIVSQAEPAPEEEDFETEVEVEEVSEESFKISDFLSYSLSMIQEKNVFKFVLNLIVQNPSFYDSEDKVRECTRLLAFLKTMKTKLEVKAGVYLAFPLSAEMMLSPEVRKEFIDYLLEEDFAIHSQTSLEESEYPIAKESFEDIMTDSLLFVKNVEESKG